MDPCLMCSGVLLEERPCEVCTSRQECTQQLFVLRLMSREVLCFEATFLKVTQGMAQDNLKHIVRVNFLCQPGWAVVPKYLVKYFFECSVKVFFWIRLTFKSLNI